ncbi:hypothetical protein [Nocardioides litoris]|uniref:hypothetical protein n=1 Tax=Nocardioides litoris TaxID=1926648 RepID=UPI001FEB4EE4|nr:hypothetical protein [Nocardioides litoris]
MSGAPEVRTGLSSGPGRVLVFGYGLFAVAATGRSLVQLGADPGRAPFAYSLSVVAAVLYLVATTCLLAGSRRAWTIALAACSVELVGVLSIGTLSYVETQWFPDRTVWSHFGQGYGYLPLVLPVLGLAWLRATRPGAHGGSPGH